MGAATEWSVAGVRLGSKTPFGCLTRVAVLQLEAGRSLQRAERWQICRLNGQDDGCASCLIPSHVAAKCSNPSQHEISHPVATRAFVGYLGGNDQSPEPSRSWNMAPGRIAVAIRAISLFMKPEVEFLVGLVARSIYERWKAGRLSPNVTPEQPADAKRDWIPSTALVAYDPSSNRPEMELLGCASTHTPGTARTGKQKPP
jgi:hypothetical protein